MQFLELHRGYHEESFPRPFLDNSSQFAGNAYLLCQTLGYRRTTLQNRSVHCLQRSGTSCWMHKKGSTWFIRYTHIKNAHNTFIVGFFCLDFFVWLVLFSNFEKKVIRNDYLHERAGPILLTYRKKNLRTFLDTAIRFVFQIQFDFLRKPSNHYGSW